MDVPGAVELGLEVEDVLQVIHKFPAIQHRLVRLRHHSVQAAAQRTRGQLRVLRVHELGDGHAEVVRRDGLLQLAGPALYDVQRHHVGGVGHRRATPQGPVGRAPGHPVPRKAQVRHTEGQPLGLLVHGLYTRPHELRFQPPGPRRLPGLVRRGGDAHGLRPEDARLPRPGLAAAEVCRRGRGRHDGAPDGAPLPLVPDHRHRQDDLGAG
mmetsp:Transcript_103027/g.291820  ORF Transcript_103027/g.291820 Transcript_103027/m.291820 type:complete len:210 (-) Transcript_103027:209-838(-)